MLEETNGSTNRVWVHLFAGEQDGFRTKIELKTDVPKKFYIHHIVDGAKIDEAKGKNRMVLKHKLAVMAYELFDTVTCDDDGLSEYRYRRIESADKVADTAV